MIDKLLFEYSETALGFIIKNARLLAGTTVIGTPAGYFMYPIWTKTVQWWESTQEWKITDGGKPEMRNQKDTE